jgi:zinc protease
MKLHRSLRLPLAVLLLACACTTVLAAEVDLNAPLPVDPAVRIVELPNGLHVWIRHNATPPDHVGIYMHVGSGSLNEIDEERGLAHFLEHMAFDGSEHFPPGELVKYFESIGLRFGNDQNAFTSYDQTTYTLTLPRTDRATVSKGLLCMADFAFRLSLLPEQVDNERKVVLEEVRARSGAGQRIRDEMMPVLLPGSRVAERMPIGKEAVIEKADRQQLLSYYRKWYRPDDTTLLIVGDVDVDMVLDLVREQFGEWQPTPDPPAGADPGIKPYGGVRAAVFTDPEVTETDVGSASVRPLERLQTVGDLRRTIVDGLGEWMANRRFQEMVQKGTAPFQQAEVDKSPFLNACTYIDASATGAPAAWQPMMASLLTELKRAREHGFLPEEFAQAKKDLLARAEQRALTESTRDSGGFLGQMNSLLSEHRKPISAQQTLDLTRALIGTVTLEEVSEAFRANYAPDARLLTVVMPQREGLPVPAGDDLLGVATQVAAAQVAPPVGRKLPQGLLAREPAPGSVAASEEDGDLGVLSVTLSNGVRAHLRSMDFKKDQVLVGITLGGGAIRETEANRGITNVAALAFSQPASDTLSSSDIEDLMTGKNVDFGGGAGPDAVSISVTSATKDVEEAFRLIHLMLTQPRIEPSALLRWKQEAIQAIEKRSTDAAAQAGEQVGAILSGGDPRFRSLTAEQVNRLTLEEGQAWLDDLVRSAPVELAVVGDVDRDHALQLTLKYLGSLPARPLRDPALDALRKLSYGSGPIYATVGVPTITPRSVVVEGWRGADWTQVKDRRILQIIAQILSSRLRVEVREQRGLTYTIYAYTSPGQAYPGEGLLAITFTADPEKAAGAADLSLDVGRKLAEDGPTDEELHTVREQFANSILTSQKEPAYWVSVMSDMDYHGTVLADVKDALKQYTSYTREDMMDVMGRYLTPRRCIQVIALPTQAPSGEDKPEGQPQQ